MRPQEEQEALHARPAGSPARSEPREGLHGAPVQQRAAEPQGVRDVPVLREELPASAHRPVAAARSRGAERVARLRAAARLSEAQLRGAKAQQRGALAGLDAAGLPAAVGELLAGVQVVPDAAELPDPVRQDAGHHLDGEHHPDEVVASGVHRVRVPRVLHQARALGLE